MISLNHLFLSYPDGAGRVEALHDVTLEPTPGSLVGITGPSGSGKSSLLAVASTLARPDSGSVVIDGIDATALSASRAAALRRRHLGIVFQQANLLPSLTAREQLLAVTELSGMRAQRRLARSRADDLLNAVGLTTQARLRPHQLSGGQRQRVNIARALIGEPTVLLVDEPTSALDTANGAAVLELIGTLTRDRGFTTLLVTHDLQHAARFDSLVKMVDGRLLQPEAVAAV